MKGTSAETPAVSDLTLERYRLGELPEAEAQALREALAANLGLRDRLAALERSDEAILDAHPPGRFAAAVRQRLAAEPAKARSASLWKLAPVAALSLAVAFAGAFALRGTVPEASPGGAPAGDRLKGGSPSLLLFRKGPDTMVERLDSGAIAHARDVLQVAYQAGGRRYGVIVSVDGRGVVTRHLPATGEEAAALQPNGASVLEAAYRLDDAPEVERFYFVAGDELFAVAPVVAAARSAALDPQNVERLPLDPPLAQASFLLRKE